MSKSTKSATHGMLLGKFLPPHLGHVYLADFARHYVDHLTIIVGTLSNEPIDGELRYQWMKELCPHANVVHLKKDLPQDPSEHPDFWNIWRTELEAILPNTPDVVFASESYGHRLAEELGAKFIPVDPQRESRAVSGTTIRDNPYENWNLIPNIVKPYYLKRVCVFGPESTGKSTLTANLAKHFNTIGVKEYARTYLEELGTELQQEQLVEIARGQLSSETALTPYSNKLLIADTDLLLTTVWSQFLYGSCDPWITEEAQNHDYDLYLLTDVDVPWVKDDVRYLPNDRENFLDLCEQTLIENNRNYIKLSGSWEDRTQKAIEAVAQLISI